jgi:hypothetical protein
VGENKTTDGGIQYETLDGSPKISCNWQGTSLVEEIKLSWADVTPFLSESYRPSSIPGTGTSTTYGRCCPYYPWMETDTVEVVPFDPEATPETCPWAKAVITYRTKVYEKGGARGMPGPEIPVGGNIVVTYNGTIGAETWSFPKTNLFWQSADGPVLNQDPDANLYKLIPTTSHQLTFERVKLPPWEALSNAIGKVNLGQWLFGAPSGSLMFLGVNSSASADNAGNVLWRLEYRFEEKVISFANGKFFGSGWLMSYSSQLTGFFLVTDYAGNQLYDSADFSTIFPTV